MKIKQISILTILSLLLSMTVGSCYKEDVNTLYSRQYALAGSLKALNEQVNKVNENISNIREIIQILENKEPISALEYDIVTKPDHSKDTIGVKVTIGTKQIYIPFGRDGKDGKDGKDGETPQVEIGSNGNWFVNGKDTGVPATGQDGKTPKIGAMQDPDNPTDENFYWTISYGDGKPPVFILDANGNKIKLMALREIKETRETRAIKVKRGMMASIAHHWDYDRAGWNCCDPYDTAYRRCKIAR